MCIRDSRKLARKVLEGRYTKLEEGVRHIREDLPWVAPWKLGPSTTPDVRRKLPKRG